MNQSLALFHSPAHTSCQQLTFRVTDTLFSAQLFFTLLSSLLFISLTAALYKTKTIGSLLTSSQLTLPDTLKTLLHRHQLSESDCILSKDTSIAGVTLGLFAPQIILSKKLVTLLSPLELEAVFLHELYHKRQYHPLKLSVLALGQRVLFFFPILKDISSHFSLYFETTADAFAVQTQKTNLHLQAALYKLLNVTTPELALSVGISTGDLSARIEALKHNQSPQLFFSKKHLTISLLSLLCFSVLALYPQGSVAQSSENSCTLMSCASQCLQQYQSQPMSNL